jgi:hypothetical protein
MFTKQGLKEVGKQVSTAHPMLGQSIYEEENYLVMVKRERNTPAGSDTRH